MIDYESIEKTLHFLAKRIKPKFNFIDESQWYASFGDMECNGYYKCLICDHVIQFSEADPNSDYLYDHAIFHIKDANLGAFL